MSGVSSRNEKIIAFLLTLLLSLTGVAYAGLTQRIGTLETDRKDLSQVAKVIEIQTAVMNEQIATMKTSSDAIIARLNALDDSQKRLAAISAQQNRDYQDALRRWEALVDKLTKGK